MSEFLSHASYYPLTYFLRVVGSVIAHLLSPCYAMQIFYYNLFTVPLSRMDALQNIFFLVFKIDD